MAVKHFVQTDMRAYLIPHLNTLLDERTFYGNGVTSHETLR
jgi:hypothetical protein